MALLRCAIGRLNGDLRRTLATLLAVLIAVTSFVVLTGSADTARLEVTGTVSDNFRGAYDVLVRPKGSTNEVEGATGQVRASFLSGVYGGITLEQVRQIQALGGIEAAAPLAMVGVTFHQVTQRIPIAELPPGERFVIRYTTHTVARNGVIDLPVAQGFVYVTRQPFTKEVYERSETATSTGVTVSSSSSTA